MQPFNTSRQTLKLVSIVLVAGWVVLTLIQDKLESQFNGSRFFGSESFLFSSFWWIFPPLLYVQFRFLNRSFGTRLAGILLLPSFHLALYPLVVFTLSALFYSHTFRLLPTFQYALAEYLFVVLTAYTIPILAYEYFRAEPTVTTHTHPLPANQIWITDGPEKTPLNVSDIYFIAANTPYISIHLHQKKHLYTETLRDIAARLDPGTFVRIHKSTIVNIQKIQSCKSRLNGDYDLLLTNGAELRVSRNFAADFKSKIGSTRTL